MPFRTLARCLCCASILSLTSYAADKPTDKKSPAEPAVPSYYGPQPATESLDLNMYARIRDEGLKHSHVMQFAEALTDGIGPRLTGSPNMAKANAWTRDTLTKIGLENAHLEDWGEFGMGWQQVNTWVRMVSPDSEPIWAQAAPWSPSTNGPVTGEAVFINLTKISDLDPFLGKLQGKIVLLGIPRPTPDVTDSLFHRYSDGELKDMETSPITVRANANPDAILLRLRAGQMRTEAVKKLASEGVIAILTPSRDSGGGGGTGIIFDDNGADLTRDAQKKQNAVPIPNAVMMIEHYNRLTRMLSNHVPVTL
jgi:carboxypeptidase Q